MGEKWGAGLGMSPCDLCMYNKWHSFGAGEKYKVQSTKYKVVFSIKARQAGRLSLMVRAVSETYTSLHSRFPHINVGNLMDLREGFKKNPAYGRH